MAWRKNKWAAYQAAFHKLTSMVDGVLIGLPPLLDQALRFCRTT